MKSPVNFNILYCYLLIFTLPEAWTMPVLLTSLTIKLNNHVGSEWYSVILYYPTIFIASYWPMIDPTAIDAEQQAV